MPVPKRKRSRARRDSRFANKGLKAKPFSLCANCKSTGKEIPLLSHQTCMTCGFYKGRKILATKAERAEKRGVARKARSERQAQTQTKPAQSPTE